MQRRRRRAGLRAGARSSATGCRRCAPARAPARRQRRRRHARRDRGRGRGDRGQRAGLPGPRRGAVRPPVLLPRQRGRAGRRARSPRRSSSSTTSARGRSRRRWSSSAELGERPALAEALAQRRGGPVEIRAAERGDKRRILELAERNARLAIDQEKLRAERRRQRRVEALEGLQQALGLDTVPLRIECFDISNLMGTHTVASMVVFEGGAPKKSDYRRFRIRDRSRASDDFASMEEVLAGGWRGGRTSATSRRTTPTTTRRSPRCRTLVVIDGGKGQLVARPARRCRASATAA